MPDPNSTSNEGEIPQRPENFPEAFWDAEKGAVKFEALTPKLTEYGKVETDYTALKTQVESAPKAVGAADKIDWTLPKDLDPSAPDVVYEINKDDAMVKEFSPVLAELPQPVISKLVTAMAKYQLNLRTAAREKVGAEEKLLGDKYGERIAGAQAFVEKALTAGGMDATKAKERALNARNSWFTAEQIETIESLAKYAAGPRPILPNGGVAGKDSESKGRSFYDGMAQSEKPA